MSLEPLSIDRTIVRLSTLKETFLPEDRIPLKALPAAFELSTDDKEEGKQRGLPALLSVWDAGLHELPEIKSLRESERPCAGYVLKVQSVNAVKVVFEDKTYTARVLSDPIVLKGSLRKGHAGIEGLERKDNDPRRPYRELRQMLSDCTSLHPDEDENIFHPGIVV